MYLGILPNNKSAKHLGGVFYNSFLTIRNKKCHRNALYYKDGDHLRKYVSATPINIALQCRFSSRP